MLVLGVLMTFAASASESITNSTSVSATNLCAPFTLQDQFEKTHQFTFPQTKPVVLTVADKKGSDDIKGWAHPLADKFGDQITIAGLADMSTVPAPLRGFVRSKFKKAIAYPVMLDWQGNASRSFNYTKGKANVYLIGCDGSVLQHLAGEADVESLKQLGGRIEKLITNPPPANASPAAAAQ